MELVIHGHQTDVSNGLRYRTEEGLRRIGTKLRRAIIADVRFEEDGVMKAVEIVLQAPNNILLVGKAENKHHGTALTEALAKIEKQIEKVKTVQKRKRVASSGPRTP